MSGHDQAAAIDNEIGSFVHAKIDVAANFLVVSLRDQGSHVVTVVDAGADFQVRDLLLQLLDNGIGCVITDADGYRNRHAAFATGTEGRTHQRADSIVDIGVRHDDRVILCPAQRLHSLAVFRAGGVDVLGNRGGADEAHGLDAGVVQ